LKFEDCETENHQNWATTGKSILIDAPGSRQRANECRV